MTYAAALKHAEDLAQERQELRSDGADGEALERNRLALAEAHLNAGIAAMHLFTARKAS